MVIHIFPLLLVEYKKTSNLQLMPVQQQQMEIISLFCALSCECLIGPKIDSLSLSKINLISL